LPQHPYVVEATSQRVTPSRSESITIPQRVGLLLCRRDGECTVSLTAAMQLLPSSQRRSDSSGRRRGLRLGGSRVHAVSPRSGRISSVRAIGRAFSDGDGGGITWVSPLRAERFAEYQDRGFLQRIGLGALSGVRAIAGPGVGRARRHSSRWAAGCRSAGGKELSAGAVRDWCQAGPASRAKIHRALTATQIMARLASRALEKWCGPLYQTANSLPHQPM
jgi:hypothetical protein